MVAAGTAGCPELIPLGAGGQVVAVEFVKATAGQAQFLATGLGWDVTGAKFREDVLDQRRATAVLELTFFIRTA